MTQTPRPWNLEADRLAAEGLAADDPTGWYERLWASARTGEVSMPWDRTGPQALLAAWTAEQRLDGTGRTAVVVGCGLGADAEHLASLGYAVTAFDISGSAVREVRARRPESPVHYREANLLALPQELRGAFDLVVEIYTVQSVPRPLRAEATEAVKSLVAPGGTLFVVTGILREGEDPDEGPPWLLDLDEVDALAAAPLEEVRRDVGTSPVQERFTLAMLELRRPD